MSRESVEIVEKVIGRLGAGEWDHDLFNDDIEVHDHDVLDAGSYRGRAGFDAWVADWGAAWNAFSIDAGEYFDAGERVVFAFRLTAQGRSSGLRLTRQDAMVWTVREGRVTRLDYYNNRQQALAAAGLSE